MIGESDWGPLGPAVSDVIIAALDAADPSLQRQNLSRAIEYLDEAKRLIERQRDAAASARPVWLGRVSASGIPIIRRAS